DVCDLIIKCPLLYKTSESLCHVCCPQLYATANNYHLLHSLALLGAAQCRKPLLAGGLLTAGMGLFCGALYHQAVTGDPRLRKLAPIGGTLLIAGWAAIAL
uniref:Transmembrane protein 256 n=1 Tax=Paramormyrops kingsleyae TaxID=1676925 RepID=A0A3B3SNP2_9TELE